MNDETKIITIAAISFLIGAALILFFTSEDTKNSIDQQTALRDVKTSKNTQSPVSSTQEQSGGGVTVTVTYLNTHNDRIQFEVAMNTHTVPLDEYKLDNIAYLQDDKGNTYKPLSWDAWGGGHHISGTLSFPKVQSKSITLVIPNIAGVDRVFTWQ
jgi:hypothetical protein